MVSRILDPWQAMSRETFVVVGVTATLIMLAMGIFFMVHGERLRFGSAPRGIGSLELARTSSKAQDIVAQWKTAGLTDLARNDVRLDYVFLIAYAIALSIGCAAVARSASSTGTLLSSIAATLSWLVLLAGLMDAMENIALLRMLSGTTDQPWPAIAAVMAYPKFAISLSALAFILVTRPGT